MSMGVAFASAFFGELNDKKRAQAKAERDAEIRAEERQAGYDLATFKADRAEANTRLAAELRAQQSDAEYDRDEDYRNQTAMTAAINAMPEAVRLAAFKDPDFMNEMKKVYGYNISPESINMAIAAENAANTSLLMGTSFKVGWDFSGSKKLGERQDNTLDAFENYLASPENVSTLMTHLADNPQEVGILSSAINTHIKDHVIRKQKPIDADAAYLVDVPSRYGNMLKLNDTLMQVLGAAGNSSQYVIASEIEALFPGGLPENSFYKKGVSETEGVAVGSAVTFSANDYADIEQFAGQVYPGMDGNYLINNLEDISYNTDPVNQLESVVHAANLNGMYVQDMSKEAVPPEVMESVSMKLYEVGGEDNNLNAQIAAIYPVLASNKELYPELVGVKETITGPQFIGQSKAEGITKRYTAARNVVDMATRLRENRVTLGTTGIIRTIQEGVSGVFSANGTLAQVANATFVAGNVEDDVTMDSLMERAKKVGTFVNGINDLEDAIGEAKVLEFNLAVQIARAADPNGRLSNQDFENALRTIGSTGFFSSLDRDISALDTTIGLYTDVRNELEYMNELAGKQNVTRKDKIALSAYNIAAKANKYNKQMGRGTRAAAAAAAEAQAPTVPEDFPQNATRTLEDGTELYFYGGNKVFSMGWYGVVDGALVPATEEQLKTVTGASGT